MQCKKHPATEAADRCAGCAEAFCADCLVEIHGQKYCGACKTMTLKGSPPVIASLAARVGTIECKEASEALTYALVGILCFGFILQPIALVKASEAKKKLDANPELTGSGKVTAARIIAIVVLVLNLFYFINLFSKISGSHA
jgi:hypothetical protein